MLPIHIHRPRRRIHPLNSRTKLSDRRRILDGRFYSCYPLPAILPEISANILPIRSAPYLVPFSIPRSSRTPSISDLLPRFLIPVPWLKIHPSSLTFAQSKPIFSSWLKS